MVTREQALIFLREKLQNINLQRHSLAVEAIMRELAEFFKEDVELWSLTGLMHDVDYELTKDDMTKHSLISAEWLKDLSYPEPVVQAIKVHNDMHGILPQTRMERALIYSDAISGLLVAAALVKPSKRIADVTTESVLKKFKEKDFARGVHRDLIKKCEEDNVSLEEFISISLGSLQRIADQVGL